MSTEIQYEPCEFCNGTGRIAVAVRPEGRPCQPIQIGHETVECFASRPHPGEPHMAILCAPCYACGAYDEHHDSCAVYDMDPWLDGRNEWYWWEDGDLAVTHEPDLLRAGAWRRAFQPRATAAA